MAGPHAVKIACAFNTLELQFLFLTVSAPHPNKANCFCAIDIKTEVEKLSSQFSYY
jgi:hypothetical protein